MYADMQQTNNTVRKYQTEHWQSKLALAASDPPLPSIYYNGQNLHEQDTRF